MFDQVGRGEQVATRNRAGALGMTALSIAFVIGVTLGIATIAVQEVLAPPAPNDPIVFLDAPPDAPLDLPAAPPPPARGTADPDATPVVIPLAPPENPAPLDPVVPNRVMGTPGPLDGSDHGALDGKKGGKPLGNGTGDGDGDPTGGNVHRTRYTDLEVKRRFEPTYPPAAKGLGLGDVRCLAEVRISAEGVPTDVLVTGCPSAFHAETRESLYKWRFYPVRAGKTAVPTLTTFAVAYRLQ